MGLINLNCSNCGADLEFDEKQKIGFCSHCGTKHILEDINNTIINNVKNEIKIESANIVNGPSEDNLLGRAMQFKQNGDLKNALSYANKVLDINSKNEEANKFINEAICIEGKYLTSFKIDEINEYLDKINSETNLEKAEFLFKELVVSIDSFIFGTKQQYSKCSKTVISFLNEWRQFGLNKAYKLVEKLNKQITTNINDTNDKVVVSKTVLVPPKENVKRERPNYIILLGVIILGIIVGYLLFLLINTIINNYKESEAVVVEVGEVYTYDNISYMVKRASIVEKKQSSLGDYTDYYMDIVIEVENNSAALMILKIETFYLISPNGEEYLLAVGKDDIQISSGSKNIITISFKNIQKETGCYKLYYDLFSNNNDPCVLIYK